MSHTAEEYAKSLGVRIGRPKICSHFFPIAAEKYITLQTTSKDQSKNYSFWGIVSSLINNNCQKYKIVQVGLKDDPKCEFADLDLRGATSFKNLFYIIENSSLHMCSDGVGAHISSAVDTPCVALFSNFLPENSGPIWHVNSEFKCIQPDLVDVKPSYSSSESPKSIDSIEPEIISRSALDLLGAKHNLDTYKTLNIGRYYSNKIIEIIPDAELPKEFSTKSIINVRCDYGITNEGMVSCFQRKINLMTDKPLNINYINAFKSNIVGMTIFLEIDNFSEDYLLALKKIGIKFSLICRNEEMLSKIRFKFFDWVVEKYSCNKKKDLDFCKEVCNNTYYESNKVLISKNKEYPSKASWKAGIESKQKKLKIIDNEDFWEEVEHFNIYNHGKSKKRTNPKNRSQ